MPLSVARGQRFPSVDAKELVSLFCPTMPMDLCRFGTRCWRPLCPYGHACSGKRAREWAETWAFLATQEEADEDEEQIVDLEEEILEVVKDSPRECFPSASAGSSGPGADDASSAVGQFAGEAWVPGIAKHSASTESVFAVSSGEAGP